MAEIWKKGDVFLVPIDRERVGIGQIVDVLPLELYVVVFEDAWSADRPPSIREVLGRKPFIASLTLDAKLHNGDWKIIGNLTDNLSNIEFPYSKVRISGEMCIESHDGGWSRPATVGEAEQLRFRKTVAPVRLEKALQAHYGLLNKHTTYDDLCYDLVVKSARVAGEK